ncbi:hypothetical protein TNCV_3625461 [Trichonephila clavipes]|nr:hypothetical protein TNCV_3625461 [Trichonephila clavipes]
MSPWDSCLFPILKEHLPDHLLHQVSSAFLAVGCSVVGISNQHLASGLQRLPDNGQGSFELVGCLTHHQKRSQICSIGEKSGDRVGQGRVVKMQRQSCDTYDV